MPYTPGPWNKNKYGELKGANGEQVVVWDSGIAHDCSRAVPESEANGRLMAAAPELLEALSELSDAVESYAQSHKFDTPCDCTLCTALANAEAAICKAISQPTTANADTHAAHGAGLRTGQSGSVPTERKL